MNLIVKLGTRQIQYPAKSFSILINMGGLQVFNQLLYCLLVGRLYFNGDVTWNMTCCSGVTTMVITLQEDALKVTCKVVSTYSSNCIPYNVEEYS